MDKAADKRPTLKTLAEVTGLGISTVSQALRDSPAIAEETRRRVQLAAKQAGYRPNRAGVRLRTGKTNVITVVLNAQDEGSGFFSDFVYGVAAGLSGTPYHLVITPYSSEDDMSPIRYIAETSSADGVVISRTQPDDARVRFLQDNNIPFVTHGRTVSPSAHPFIDFDNEAFAHEAVRILQQRGRKRAALLGPPPQLTYHMHTNRGFERGLQEFKLISVPLGSADIDQPLQSTRALGRQLADMPNRPDGFVVSSTTSAVALAVGLREAGLQITKDFDIVSKFSSQLTQLANPDIISIPEDFGAAGRSCAELLVQAIDGVAAEDLQRIHNWSSQG
jgi:LacI family transcriptional regulator